jgi:predicted transcriptional regulator
MNPSLGNQEIELLKFISDHPEPIAVRKIIDGFGEPRGLARTTILTMLERLRKKGFVTREILDGVYHYTSKTSKNILLQNMVKEFVEKTLGGSISPFVNYLTQKVHLTENELAEFRRLIANYDPDVKRNDETE